MIRRAPRIRHAAVLFSGLVSPALAQTCGNPWSVGATAPSARFEQAAAFASARSKIIPFGGVASGNPSTFFGDTWEWTAAGPSGGGAWALSPATGPSGRYNAGLAYDSARG